MIADVESETFIDPERVVIRPLTGADSTAYRRLRQHILEIGEGKYFSSSYTSEQQLTTEAQWRERCTETSLRCTIGTFVDGALVGIMCIQGLGLPGNLTAEWDSTWIDPKYRRTRVARQAYDAVRAWCQDHGYRYAIVDIRADNARSREIREKQGAIYLYTRPDVTWADGSTADTHFFMLSIGPGTETVRAAEPAIAFLEAALAFVKHEHAV